MDINDFFQNNPIKEDDQRKTEQILTTSCNQVFKDQNHRLAIQLELDNDNLPRKSF